MHELTCQRCGHGWEYSGQSEHYCTCPNCKTSVSVRGSERAEPSETAERGTTSDRTPETVAVQAGGHEEREMELSEAIVALDESVTELYELQSSQSGSVGELAQEAEERERSVDDLERGLEEVASYFKQVMEEMGGEVEYDHVDAGRAVPEALKDADMDGVYDPSEEFSG